VLVRTDEKRMLLIYVSRTAGWCQPGNPKRTFQFIKMSEHKCTSREILHSLFAAGNVKYTLLGVECL
jgi:hypothetical protein